MENQYEYQHNQLVMQPSHRINHALPRPRNQLRFQALPHVLSLRRRRGGGQNGRRAGVARARGKCQLSDSRPRAATAAATVWAARRRRRRGRGRDAAHREF